MARLEDKVSFKIYDVTPRLTNNCNTHITNISRSKDSQTIKFGHCTEHKKRNIVLQKSCKK